MKYQFILLVATTLLSGCSLISPQKNTSPTMMETLPSSSTSSLPFSQQIKTQYGFDFDVPEGWKLEHTEAVFPPYKEALIINDTSHPQEHFMRVVKEPLSTAPTSNEGIDQGEETILTKNNILEEKKEIEKTAKNIDGVSILSDIRYDVPGGEFYQYAKFFYKENLITFYFPLREPFENMMWGEEARMRVATKLTEIKKGTMSEASKTQIKTFQAIINSLKFH